MSQDYSHQNLRGRSFKGQNLEGADFCYTDIRGANFAGANLRGANFTGAKAGLQRPWAIFLVMFFWLLLGTSGFLFRFNSDQMSHIFNFSYIEAQFIGWSAVIVTTITFSTFIRQGILAVVVFIVLVGFSAGIPSVSVSTIFILNYGFNAVALVGAVGAFVVSLVGAFAIGALRIIVTAWVFIFVLTFHGDLPLFFGAGIIISTHIAWQTIKGDEKYIPIYNIAIIFAAYRGTSFYSADLTDANFTGATLKNTDFGRAKLIRTRFYETKKLDFARVGDSILFNRKVLNLLVTGNGRNKSYAGLNLKGANLIGADLKKVNLKNADITEATFQGACLEWSNLTLTTAIETDFSNALMTGACVEAWNIESTTNLDNVDCRFIYLLENPKTGTDDRERRPSSGEFRPGEFTKLFEEVFNTVDLIFRDGIDWKAFVTAFKKVQVENENTELAIQSIENKGDGVVVVKVAVPVDTDKEKIHSGFTQNYQLALQEIEKRYKAELQAKDKEIEIHREKSSDMKEIIGLLANRPIQNIIDVKQNQGDTNMTGERNIHIIDSGNYNERIEGNYIQGNYYAAGEKQTLAETAAEIQALLKQLEKSYPTDTTTGKMALATEAIAQIENNPNLTARILSALKVGSIKAFEQLLSHPAASFVIGALEDWEKTKEN